MLKHTYIWCCVLPILDEGPGGADDVMDPYDLMEPVEILSKLPKDYYEKIVSSSCWLDVALLGQAFVITWLMKPPPKWTPPNEKVPF